MKILVDKMQIEVMLNILNSFNDISPSTPISDISSPLSQVKARLLFILESNEHEDSKLQESLTEWKRAFELRNSST